MRCGSRDFPGPGVQGSVLMETVLVLPVLLLLLGGLFILGDLALGRLHLGTVDRAAAWGSGSRFSEPSFRSWFAYVPKTSALEIERVRAGEPVTTNGVSLRGNRWLGFYAGYAHGKVAVPFWIGMANARNIMVSGPEEDRFREEWKLFSDTDGDGVSRYRDSARSFVVHRRSGLGGTNAWNRTLPVKDLSWLDVAGDSWCGGVESAGLSGRPAGNGFRRHPYALLVGE